MREYTTSPSVRPTPDLSQGLAAHEGLVRWVVRRQWLGVLPYAKALHVGRIGLWQALRGYDPDRGIAFSTYAVPAITRAVWRAVAQTHSRATEHLTPQPPQAVPDPSLCSGQALEATAETSLLCQTLHQLVADLPQPLQTVIVARYGLTGHTPQTFAAIGQQLGVTRQRAQQLHRRGGVPPPHPGPALAGPPRPLPQAAPAPGLQHRDRLPRLSRPRPRLGPRPEETAMSTPSAEPEAHQKRAAHPDFVPIFSLDALRDRLPLRFPVPSDVPPSPKPRYRSAYRYLGWEDWHAPVLWATLTLFEIALYLIDFSPLRDFPSLRSGQALA